MPRSTQLVLCLAVVGAACAQPTPARRPLGVVSAEPTANATTGATATDDAATTTTAWEAYVEPVELDHASFQGGHVYEVGAGYALVEKPFGRGARFLLDLSTLATTPLPAFVGDPLGEEEEAAAAAAKSAGKWKAPPTRSAKRPPRLRIHGLGGVLLAEFQDDENRRVFFQVLTLDTMQWELAGEFLLPEQREPEEAVKRTAASLVVWEGVARLDLTDGYKIVATHEFDPVGLVWKPASAPVPEGPCALSTKLPDADVVRWGASIGGGSAQSCIAVRRTEDEPWRLVEDPAGADLAIARTFQRIDATRVLVTGGIQFKIFAPFVSRADVVDLHNGEIRLKGEPALGPSMTVPGEPFLWAGPTAGITRFDPDTETFTTVAGPRLGFEPTWQVRLDERTYLYGRHLEGDGRAARFGFREVPKQPGPSTNPM